MSIEFRQVTKRYGDKKSPLVVKGVDLVVPKGTLTTILGPSGCGKTTLLRMIAGLDAPTSGTILIDGQDVTSLGPAERNVSMVFQSYALFPHMTVLDNVCYGLSVQGIAKDEAVQRARATMDSVGLKGYDERLPSELSGGQQQRVAVARSLVLEPSVMLFDEPLSNLDARLRRSMREEIRALQQRLGLTVAYVTHDQSEALAVSDQIIVMEAGLIAQAGTPQQLYEHPNSEFVAGFMGEAMLFSARADAGGRHLAEDQPAEQRHVDDLLVEEGPERGRRGIAVRLRHHEVADAAAQAAQRQQQPFARTCRPCQAASAHGASSTAAPAADISCSDAADSVATMRRVSMLKAA
jgi:iron(III) transport system ATP-binding protein